MILGSGVAITREGFKKYTLDEWKAKGEKLFGKDLLDWKFVCPACGRVTAIQEFKDLDVDPNQAPQICIGRVNGKGMSGWTGKKKDNSDGCDWAAFGLFGTLGKGEVVVAEAGTETEVFKFYEEDGGNEVSDNQSVHGGKSDPGDD
jgi:hypothetical protein